MRSPLLALALITLAPWVAGAQQPLARLGGALGDADLLYFAGRPEQAYELLRRHLDKEPDDYEALWRAARAGVVAGVQEKRSIAWQNTWLDPAIALGDRAVALRPDGIDGLYWRGAAAGRRALNAGPGYAAELAQRVYDDAHAILELEPDHGGAHNLLGKLNYEIMSLSAVERFIGRHLVRKPALRASNWESAELHLRWAAEAWPDQLLFQFDLAQLYRKRNRKDEAREALRRVTEMVPTHPPDASFQDDARRHLEELGS
jgi:tetratricopeptide (TPR) repeat protein